MPVTALDSPFLGNLFGSKTIRAIFDDIDDVLRPENYLGSTEALINNVLTREEPSSDGDPSQ